MMPVHDGCSTGFGKSFKEGTRSNISKTKRIAIILFVSFVLNPAMSDSLGPGRSEGIGSLFHGGEIWK